MKQAKTIILFLFFLLLPTQLGKHFFLDFSYINGVRVDYLAPTIYLTDLLSLLLIIFNIQTIRKHLKKSPHLHLLLLYAVAFNVVMSMYSGLAFYYALKYIQIYLLAVIFMNGAGTKEAFLDQLWLAMTALSIGAGVEILLSVLQITTHGSLQGVFYFMGERYFTASSPGIALTTWFDRVIVRPYGTFSHPNSLAGFYVFVAALALQVKNQRFLYLKNALLGLSAILVFISFSKTAIIALLLVTLYSIYKDKKDCLPCITAHIVIFVVISALFLQAHSDPLSLDKRFFLLQKSMLSLLSHPFFGVGLGHYLHALKNSVSPYPYFFMQPVHNIFILLMLQIGIPLGAWITYTIGRLLLNNRLVSIFIILLITGMMDHYWLTLQQNMLIMGVVMGLASSYSGIFKD